MSTFATCSTTTAQGLYANSFFELIHYAFGGSAGTVSACPLRLDHGVEQACSAAARVPPRSPSPGAPLLRVLVLCLRYEASAGGSGWDPSSLRHGGFVPTACPHHMDLFAMLLSFLRSRAIPTFLQRLLLLVFGFVRVYAVVWRYSGPLL